MYKYFLIPLLLISLFSFELQADEKNNLSRRVEAKIFASFPKMEISPQICTLNGIDIKNRKNIKPGEYKLRIKHAGNISITTTIEILPSNQPYIISHILNPKDVKFKLEITYDIEPENKKQSYICRVKNETSSGIKVVDGQKIKLESYLFEVFQSGYQVATKRVVIMPSENPYVLKCH
ncbi:hypothetical protein [Candidatus Uabimicrobium sp. HlEnr_7]|uniref:hypothetical protein n=1 Tax=Candidatus Uabimicrobium helgolandensis TaxID=3095367 RepID=UPI0035589A5D